MDKVLNTRIKQTVELEERIDSHRLNAVSIMLQRGCLDLNDQSRLGMLLANIQDHANPRFATVYERKLFKYKGEWHHIGRMPPKIKSGGSNQLKSGMCATLMQRDLRNLLYLGNVDLDQVCAVQRIACDIFIHFQIPEANWSAVKDYAMHSDTVRASLMKELKVEKSEVKQAFNQLMFGGDSHLCKHSALLKGFQEQIQMCTAILMRKPELDVFLAYANKRIEEKKKPNKPQYTSALDGLLAPDDDEPDNVEGIFLAHLVFHCESVATYYMYDYLSRHAGDRVRVNTLEYDGLKLTLNDEVDTEFLPTLIRKANWAVQ